MSRAVRWTWSLRAMFALSIIACTDRPLTAPMVSESQVIASVTPELATQLDQNGKFVFAVPTGGAVQWISADRARDLAIAYLKGYGPALRKYWVRTRDAGVAEQLRPCRRVFLAESGYDPFPIDLAHEYRRAFGATWLVSFCHGDEQQVAVAVSVESTDLTIDEGGIVRGVDPGDFWDIGVPVGTQYPIEPEVGTVAIAGTVGVRVSALPRYRRLAGRLDAFSGLWTYEVESSVHMRGDHSGRDVDTNMVGFARWTTVHSLRAVMANQDSAGKSRSEIFATSSDGVTWINVEVFRRADVPVSLETFAVRNP